MVKISAIISAYFAEEYLDGRIKNLLEQELIPQIVVVCDYGSKEYDIAMKYADGDNMFCIHPAEEGIPTIYAAWNMGVEAASGEYLTNANSDDRLYPNALKRLTTILDENPKYSVAYANVAQVKKIGGEIVGEFKWRKGGLEKLLEGCFLGPMPVWRKSVHEKYGFFDESFKSAGDYEFWLRLAKGNEKFLHIDEVLGEYLLRRNSAENREPVRSIWETSRARAKYRKRFRL